MRCCDLKVILLGRALPWAAYFKVWCVSMILTCFTSEVYTSSRVAEGHAYQILLWTLLLDFILTFLKSLVHIWKGKTSLHSAKATMAPWGKAISLSRKLTELKTFGCKDKPSWKKKLNMLKQNYLFGGFIQASNVWPWKFYWMVSGLFFQD